MTSHRAHGRPLTSISEVQRAAHEGLDLMVRGEVIPARSLYDTSFRFVADQIQQGAVEWCDAQQEVAR